MLSKMKKTLVAADNIDRMNFSDVLKNCDANIEEMYNIIDKIQNKFTRIFLHFLKLLFTL